MKEHERSLFRRLIPVSSAISALFPRLVTGQVWDREYARGDWDMLFGDDQLAHYMTVLGYLMKCSASPQILEVGCGAGRLFELIKNRVGFEGYLGLDISQEAINRAKTLAVEHSAFEVADAYTFSTDKRFDVIIFNEVAYYFKKPADVLLRYTNFLRENGFIIVSMFEFLPTWFVWRRLDRVFKTVDKSRVSNHKGLKWEIRMLSPRA